MSTMPGNPHAQDAWDALTSPHDSTEVAHVSATLAVAHELRTANLLGVLNSRWANGASMFPREADEPDVRQEVLRRAALEAVGLYIEEAE